MKFMHGLVLGSLTLLSLSSFAKDTIRHPNCELNARLLSDSELILARKGYNLYIGKVKDGTLNLATDMDDQDIQTIFNLCGVDRYTRTTLKAKIERFDGGRSFTIAESSATYKDCFQSGSANKFVKAQEDSFKKLPNCVISE